MKYTYQKTIKFRDVYGVNKIDTPGYKQLGFRPPLDGEYFYGTNGNICKASFNFNTDCPLLILEKITREVIKFIERIDSPRQLYKGDWYNVSNDTIVCWLSTIPSVDKYKVYDRIVEQF